MAVARRGRVSSFRLGPETRQRLKAVMQHLSTSMAYPPSIDRLVDRGINLALDELVGGPPEAPTPKRRRRRRKPGRPPKAKK